MCLDESFLPWTCTAPPRWPALAQMWGAQPLPSLSSSLLLFSQGKEPWGEAFSWKHIGDILRDVWAPMGYSGPAAPTWSHPAPGLRLPVQGHQPQWQGPSGSPLPQPDPPAVVSLLLGTFSWISGIRCSCLKQLLCLSPDASFQRWMAWFLYTFAFSVCQALKCLSSWSILNDNMHLYSSSSSNEWGSS